MKPNLAEIHANKGFDVQDVVPTVFRRVRGRIHVFINRQLYASFGNMADAEEAVLAWSEHWPAAKGKNLTIES